MQISVIGNVATVKSELNYELLKHLGEVTVPNGENRVYTVRVGSVITKDTMSFNNEDAAGNAIIQFVSEDPMKDVMGARNALEAFEQQEEYVKAKMEAERTAEAAFINAITVE